MTDSLPVVIPENWQTYSYGSEQGPVFATFYAGANELPRDDFLYCARVMIRIKEPGESGGPGDEEAEILWGLEDSLTELLTKHRVKCILVARITHAGTRELVFQLADWESFRPPVGLWMQDSSNYEMDVSEHDGWGFFDECVWPSDEDWMLISDRSVVEGLIEAGSNPEKLHELDYSFMGEKAQLQKLRKELKSRGYVDCGAPSDDDQLVMVIKLPLDLDQIFTQSLANRQLCDDLGVEFTGWGAHVVK